MTTKHLHPKLTDVEARFVEEYFKDLVISEAYMRAVGKRYEGSAASAYGCALMRKPHVAKYIKDKANDYKLNIGVTVERVLREYCRLAFFNPVDFFNPDGSLKDLSEIPADLAPALESLDIEEEDGGVEIDGETGEAKLRKKVTVKKIRFADRTKALGQLAKFLKMTSDRVELTGANGGPIQTQAKVTVYLPSNGRDITPEDLA